MEWVFARWLTFVATALVIGVCAIGIAVLPRTAVHADLRHLLARDTVRVGVVACLAMIPASILRLTDQLLALRSPGDPILAGLGALLGSTMWGTGFLWQGASLGLALVAFTLIASRPTSNVGWALAALGALGLGVTPALQGHAVGNESNTVVALFADALHVLGAGLWIGGIAVIGWLGIAVPGADGVVHPDRVAMAETRLRLLVPLVPQIALSGAFVLATSGVVSSVLNLREVRDLWSSDWGRHVLLKAIIVLGIASLGAINWRRLGPRLDEHGVTQTLRRSLLIELGAAALVLVVTALLVVTPLPGE